MSDQPWLDGARASELALAVYRGPAGFPDLLHGRGMLPDDVAVVMRSAAEAIRHDNPDALDESQRAALFFVEHVLLAAESDHYRVLGLKADANAEQVRDHFRIMMGIFHPDRRGWADCDRERLAARINVAHQVLRNDYQRAAYDLSLRQAATRPEPVVRMPVAPVPRALRPSMGGADFSPRALWLRRNMPQLVLGGVALVGVAVVLGVWFDRPQPGAIGSRPAASAPALEPSVPPLAAAATPPPLRDLPPKRDPARAADAAQKKGATQFATASTEVARAADARSEAMIASASRGARTDPPARQLETLEGRGDALVMRTEPLLRVETQARSTENLAPPVDTSAPRREARAAQQATSAEPPAAAPSISAPSVAAPSFAAPPSPARVSSEPHPARAAAPVETGGSREAGAVEVAAAAGTALPPAAPLVPPEPAGLKVAEATDLVSRFAASYRRGEIDAFMRLFADDARSEAGSRSAIRRDYEQLFRTTAARDIQLADLRWSLKGASAKGEGGYVANISRGPGAAEETYAGAIRLELVKRGDAVLISGLFHKPAN